MSRLEELAAKRERLAARAAEQRAAIAASLAGCRRILAVADRGIAWGQWAREHPVAIAVAAAALVAMRPRLGLRWVVRALSLWRTGRFALDLVKTFVSMRAAHAAAESGQPPVRAGVPTSGQS
jgi:YqjK-like protein